MLGGQRRAAVKHHQASFRVNPQVVQMMGLVLAALAVPLTLLVLGIKAMRPPGSSSDAAPEAPGLRAALEQAADKAFLPPENVSERTCYTLPPSAGDDAPGRQRQIEEAVRKLKGVAISATPGSLGEKRIVLQIPESGANLFESQVLKEFVRTTDTHQEGTVRLYEIIFPAP